MSVDDEPDSGPAGLTIVAASFCVLAMTIGGALLGAWIADATSCDDEALLGGGGCIDAVSTGIVVGAICGGLFSAWAALAIWWMVRRQ